MKNLKCLENIVGFRTPCELITSKSGYMLNDLKGVTFRFAENIMDEEYISAKTFINDLLTLAKNTVIDEIEMFLRPYFRLNTIFLSNCLCNYIDGFGAFYNGSRGVVIQNRKPSNYVGLFVPKIQVWLQQAATITISINDGGIITTAQVTINGNVPTDVVLNYHAINDVIKIGFDNSAVNVRNTSCQVGCSGCGNSSYNNVNSDVIVYGYDTDVATYTNFFGIVPCVAVECRITNLICELNELLALPTLYKWGGLFYGEMSATNRSNEYTMYSKDKAAEMSVYYDNMDGDSPGLYQRQMKSVVHQIFPYLKSLKDGCVDCNQQKYDFVLP